MRSDAFASQYGQVLAFVRRRTRSREDAEDVTQEVFASAAAELRRSAESAPPTLAWLYTVAQRRIADQQRKRFTERKRPPEFGAVVSHELSHDFGAQVVAAFDSALETLSEAQREVIVCRLIRGLSFGDIANRLGITEAACRMRFMRGLEHLRSELTNQGVTP